MEGSTYEPAPCMLLHTVPEERERKESKKKKENTTFAISGSERIGRSVGVLKRTTRFSGY